MEDKKIDIDESIEVKESEIFNREVRLKDANQIVTNHMLFAVGFGII